MHRTLRTLVPLAALAVSAGGCLVPSDAPPTEPAPAEPIPTDLVVPADVIASYTLALDHRDLDAYVALLEPPSAERSGFTFVPPEQSLQDFPWLQGNSWGFETEVFSIDAFFGPPVAGIEARLDILATHGSPELGYDVDVAAVIRVRTVAGEERVAETRFQFLLVPDPRGYLRIRRMQEFDLGQHETWAGIRRDYATR